MARTRRCSTKKEFETTLDDLITAGYSIKSRGENNALLQKRGTKNNHLLIFLLTGWFTFGIGNLIYALIPAKVQDEVLLKMTEE